MKKISVILTFLLSLVISATVFAASIPNPSAKFYAADFAGVLSDTTESHIVSMNDSLRADLGVEIVVATVDATGGMDTGDYAYKMFNDWGIGDKSTNKGILILLAVGTDDYYTIIGTGLENSLGGSNAADIVYDAMENYFAKGDYDKGAKAAFDALANEVYDTEPYIGSSGNSGNTAAASAPRSESSSVVDSVFSVISSFFTFIIFASISFSGKLASITTKRANSSAKRKYSARTLSKKP
ncbi:hypothetical protein FACS189490_13690 [Clostridia bacterium]|nr:hypothetical protein FACS189490_13690 [Clostridia bacterium]